MLGFLQAGPARFDVDGDGGVDEDELRLLGRSSVSWLLGFVFGQTSEDVERIHDTVRFTYK